MATRAAHPSRPGTGSGRTPAAPGRLASMWSATKAVVRRGLALLAAAGLMGVAAALVMAMLTYSPLDPSANTVTGRAPTNMLGGPGAYVADLLLQGFGWAALFFAPVIVVAAVRLVQRRDFGVRRAVIWTLAGVIALAAAAGAVEMGSGGGVVGLIAGKAATILGETSLLSGVSVGLLAAVLLVPTGAALLALGTGIGRDDWQALAGLWDRRDDSETEIAVVPRRERHCHHKSGCFFQRYAPAANLSRAFFWRQLF